MLYRVVPVTGVGDGGPGGEQPREEEQAAGEGGCAGRGGDDEGAAGVAEFAADFGGAMVWPSRPGGQRRRAHRAGPRRAAGQPRPDRTGGMTATEADMSQVSVAAGRPVRKLASPFHIWWRARKTRSV